MQAITAPQSSMPWASVNTGVSMWRPSQPPMKKAPSIIRKPLSAEAVPARCGKGPTALLWLQGWCTPCPKVNRYMGTITAQALNQGWSWPTWASTVMDKPPASEKMPAMATVRCTLVRRNIQRHQKVPTM